MIPIVSPPPVVSKPSHVFFKTNKPALNDSLDPTCILAQTILNATCENGNLRIQHNFQAYFPNPQKEKGQTFFVNQHALMPLAPQSEMLDSLNLTFEFMQPPLKDGEIRETAYESMFVDARISDSIHRGKHLIEATLVTRIFRRTVPNSLDHDSQIILGCLSGLESGRFTAPVVSANRFFDLRNAEQQASFDVSFKSPPSDANPPWLLQHYYSKLYLDA